MTHTNNNNHSYFDIIQIYNPELPVDNPYYAYHGYPAVYLFIDPRDDLPFYVGKTNNHLRRNSEFDDSIKTALNKRINNGLKVYYNQEVIKRCEDILSCNTKPIICYIHTIDDNQASELELELYETFKLCNIKLLNKRKP